jgi:hypothetical protein
MSRGLGKQQLELKCMLRRASDIGVVSLRFADMRSAMVIKYGGDPKNDKLRLSVERSLKRALKGLVDRGDVLVIHGNGGQRDPYHYVTVENFAAAGLSGKEKLRDTAHAKQIAAELAAALSGSRLGR